MTQELAIIESDTPAEIEPLSEGKARVLDKRIRQAGSRVANEQDKLIELLEEAAQGQIHVALGLPSWTAYIKDALQITVADREERKALVAIMSGKGMSQRAIAGTLGVSQKTVDRDLEGESFDSHTVTAVDGKEVPRNKPPKDEPDYIEAEVVAVEEEPERTANDVIVDFEQIVNDLINDVQAVKDMQKLEPDLFGKARKRIGQRFVKRLGTVIKDLEDLSDELSA